jgi:hypothetical protein
MNEGENLQLFALPRFGKGVQLRHHADLSVPVAIPRLSSDMKAPPPDLELATLNQDSEERTDGLVIRSGRCVELLLFMSVVTIEPTPYWYLRTVVINHHAVEYCSTRKC